MVTGWHKGSNRVSQGTILWQRLEIRTTTSSSIASSQGLGGGVEVRPHLFCWRRDALCKFTRAVVESDTSGSPGSKYRCPKAQRLRH